MKMEELLKRNKSVTFLLIGDCITLYFGGIKSVLRKKKSGHLQL